MGDPEKLNIEETDVIDGIAYDKETGSLILLLADGMDWSDESKHLLLLQEKLNNYIYYIDTEQYSEKYKDVKRIEWQMNFLFKEPESCYRLLKRLKAIMTQKFKNVEIMIEHGTAY